MFGASQPAATGGLFGAAPAAGGRLFGASAAPSTGGLFGAAPAAGAGLFGASAAPATGGLFGASQPSASGGLFGASQPASTGGLFGASQPAASTSLFGAPAAAPSLFGQPPPQQLQQSAFGQPAVTAAPLFGQSQSAASASLFGSKPAFGASVAQPTPVALPKLGDPYPAPNPNEASIESRLQGVKDAWDTTNPKCRFQTFFYNVPPPPSTVAQYSTPPPGADQKAWLKALRENPDPEQFVPSSLPPLRTDVDPRSLVPAIAVGFPAVQKRIEHQTRQSAAHQARLTEIHTHLSDLSTTHALTTSLRTLRATQTAAALSSRLLALVAKVSALSPNRNLSVRKEEEELRVGLESMTGEVEGSKGRANELWAGVGALKARKVEGGGVEWAVADEEGLRKILEVRFSLVVSFGRGGC